MMLFTKSTTVLLLTLVPLSTTLAQETLRTDGNKAVRIQDNHVLLVLSQNRKVATAYSIDRNVWNKIELSPNSDADIKPVISNGMAILRVGQTVYAYSAKTAAWDKLVLPKGSDATPTLYGAVITLNDDNSFYVFGLNADGWSGVDLQTGEPLGINRGYRGSGEQNDARERD